MRLFNVRERRGVRASPMAICVLGMVVVSLSVPWTSLAQEADRAAMAAAAKREGEVIVWGALETEQANKLLGTFGKKYPFIKPHLFHATGGKESMVKLISEHKADRISIDVVQTRSSSQHQLASEGVTTSYFSPERAAFNKRFIDPKGYWTGIYMNPMVLAFNTSMAAQKDVPKTLEGLLEPRWKGKIGFDTRKTDWMVSLIEIMGREKAVAYAKRLGSMNLQYRSGNTLVQQLLIAGEFPLAFPLYSNSVEDAKERSKAPVDWAALDPVTTVTGAVGLITKAKHPNAGKLYIDFLLSKEGMSLLSEFGRIPPRPDISPRYPRLTKGIEFYSEAVDITPAQYSEYQKLWRQIFR